MVFLKDGRVLHSEQTRSNVENLLDGEVVFLPDDAPVQVFTRDEAVFSVRRVPLSGGGGYCFELTRTHR